VALSDLLLALQHDADLEVRALETAATHDATRIEAEAARTCATRLAQALRELAEHERTAHGGQLVEVERRHQRTVLEARSAMLARLHAAVKSQLPGLVDDAVRARLAAAASAFGEGTRRDVPTGVIVELADGTVVEASLAAVFERSWHRLAGEALRLIEEQA
jgi:vacuolar-type H+-ATPase subunit E/Vma4